MTSSTAPLPSEQQDRPEPPFPSILVEEMLKLLMKAVRAHQLYLHNNPTYLRAIEVLRAAIVPLWDRAEELAFTVAETDFTWEGVVVLSEAEKSGDSLPWLFYKDGIREIRLLPGFEKEEIISLLDILQRVRKASPDEDDLLTMLWEADFTHLRYRYVDLAIESAPSLGDIPRDQQAAGEATRAAVEQQEEEVLQSRAGVVNLEDFDATLYFLDEHEVDYLHQEIGKEYESDLRRNTLSMLLDIFEIQADTAVREEICGIFENYVLHLLSAAQFRAVAFLLRESRLAADRARDLQPDERTRLLSLPGKLSEPEAFAQLLQSLDESAELPPQEDLVELFEQLRPSTLGIVFSWLSRLQNPRLRTQLETAAARLASSNTGELIKLIGSPDGSIAVEAIRRAGALRTPAAVTPLARVLQEGDAVLRLASVQALAEIGSAGAMQLLERGVDDVERDVRVATMRAVGARVYRPALAKVEGVIKGKALEKADLTEKIAAFDAYGALCGDTGVPLLDGILNAKGGLFARREDTQMRACAANALGRVGTPAAIDSLRRAQSDKEAMVRNAVNRYLRAGNNP